MKFIPPYAKEAAIERATADMLTHFSSRVILKQKGSSYAGLCPFHKEQTSSFIVTPHKGIFKCFGCGKGGDTIKFLMLKEGWTYIETISYLLNFYNIQYF